MDKIICKIDNTMHETLDDLHAHLRKFKIKQADYYTEYYNKKDLLTGEQIPFKNYDQYFNQDFLNKNNLKKWLKQNPENGKEWAINWLKKRKEEKQLVYAPSSVELRTLNGPTVRYFDSVGGYYNITKKLGFKERYKNSDLSINILSGESLKIKVDTREQKPLNVSLPIIEETLNVGDYALSKDYDEGVRIERKSLNDFVGTLSSRKVERKKKENDSALERFTRELERAEKDNLYVVMLVEASLNDALSFNYLPQLKWVKATPDHIFKNLRDLLHKFPLHFQVLFVDGRIDAAKKLVNIFSLGRKQIEYTDLQEAQEQGLI